MNKHCKQMTELIWGVRTVDPEGWVGREVGVGGGTASHGRGLVRGLYPLPRKKNWTFHLKWHFSAFWAVLFASVLVRKNVHFSAWSYDLVDIEDVVFGNSEYSVRIMGLISFLLRYCIVMQAIWCLKFWNMTKSGGTICNVPPLHILGD